VRTEAEGSAFLYCGEEGLTMDRNKMAVRVLDDQSRVARPVAALLTGALLIGLSLECGDAGACRSEGAADAAH